VTEPAWRQYEHEIFELLRSKAGAGARVTADQRLPGRFSGVARQIDIVVHGRFAELPFGVGQLMIVDCKHFSRNVDVKAVEAFSGMVDDVNAALGLLITNQGYSDAAKARAGGVRGLLVDVGEFGALDAWHPSPIVLLCDHCGYYMSMPAYSVPREPASPGYCPQCGHLFGTVETS
jgi:hypothetical protein